MDIKKPQLVKVEAFALYFCGNFEAIFNGGFATASLLPNSGGRV